MSRVDRRSEDTKKRDVWAEGAGENLLSMEMTSLPSTSDLVTPFSSPSTFCNNCFFAWTIPFVKKSKCGRQRVQGLRHAYEQRNENVPCQQSS